MSVAASTTEPAAAWDHGRGTLRDCDIVGNALAGILLRTGGDPAVQGCGIRDGKTCGILVEEGGRGTVENCQLIANALAGAQFVSGGNAILRRCHIQGGGTVGILALLDGQGAVEDCEIKGPCLPCTTPWKIARSTTTPPPKS